MGTSSSSVIGSTAMAAMKANASIATGTPDPLGHRARDELVLHHPEHTEYRRRRRIVPDAERVEEQRDGADGDDKRAGPGMRMPAVDGTPPPGVDEGGGDEHQAGQQDRDRIQQGASG
jgi:hypothetical protein